MALFKDKKYHAKDLAEVIDGNNVVFVPAMGRGSEGLFKSVKRKRERKK